MTLRHRLALTLAAVPLFATLALGSCDHGSSPTAAQPELHPGVEAPEPASGSPFLLSAGKPVLPPGLRTLPVAQVMAMELVGFPHPDDVGVCFTQVASPAWMLRANPPAWLTGAPVPDRRSESAHVFLNLWRQEEPFRLHRLEVDLPQEAWAEADGRVAFLQYRMKDQHGRVHRLARCVIPASQVAADHLLDRFSYGRADRAVATPFPAGAASCPAGQLGVSAGTGAGPSAPSLVEGGDCPSGRCPCPEDNTWNVPGPAGASPHGTDGSPNCDCVFVEEVGCFPVLEVDGFLIGPGCTGWGTYFNPFWEECRCLDSSLEPDEDGDCLPDLAGPDSGGGTGCDPAYENCEVGGGGTPGNGNNNGNNACNPAEEDCPLFEVWIYLSPAQVTPGGVTTVTFEVSPPLAGWPVYLWAQEIPYSGGHMHLGRPPGQFGMATGYTDSMGRFTTTYTASAFGGVERIRGNVVDEMDGEWFEDLAVEVSGLVQLSNGANYVKIGSTDAHPDNHNGTPVAVAALVAIANAYAAEYPGSVLHYNDMSLPQGGLFDIGPRPYAPHWQFWETPHATHRFGTNADVSMGNVPEERRPWLIDLFLFHTTQNPLAEGNHWHLTF